VAWRGERRRPGKAEAYRKSTGAPCTIRAVARKSLGRSNQEFSNFFSRLFFQDIRIFFGGSVLTTVARYLIFTGVITTFYRIRYYEFINFFQDGPQSIHDASSSFSLVQCIICHTPSWDSTRAVQDSTQSPSFIYRIPSISFISA